MRRRRHSLGAAASNHLDTQTANPSPPHQPTKQPTSSAAPAAAAVASQQPPPHRGAAAPHRARAYLQPAGGGGGGASSASAVSATTSSGVLGAPPTADEIGAAFKRLQNGSDIRGVALQGAPFCSGVP